MGAGAPLRRARQRPAWRGRRDRRAHDRTRARLCERGQREGEAEAGWCQQEERLLLQYLRL